jgi:hypothetical protein
MPPHRRRSAVLLATVAATVPTAQTRPPVDLAGSCTCETPVQPRRGKERQAVRT